jgi:hypothetical protein
MSFRLSEFCCVFLTFFPSGKVAAVVVVSCRPAIDQVYGCENRVLRCSLATTIFCICAVCQCPCPDCDWANKNSNKLVVMYFFWYAIISHKERSCNFCCICLARFMFGISSILRTLSSDNCWRTSRRQKPYISGFMFRMFSRCCDGEIPHQSCALCDRWFLSSVSRLRSYWNAEIFCK